MLLELEGLKVSRMYGPISELKNKPLTRLLSPFFLREKVRNQKTGFYVFSPFGAIWAPQWTQKDTQRSASGQNIWLNVLA
jgi:hypothetical protein